MGGAGGAQAVWLMQHFFVPGAWLRDETALLPDPLAHQIVRVLRLTPGAHIQLLDDTGSAYEAELVSFSGQGVTVRIVRHWMPQTEPRTRLTLYQALLKADRWELVLQKGVELGVSRFAPLLAERSLVRADAVDERKLARWRAIIREAAEQAGRARLPELAAPQTVVEAVRDWRDEGPLLIGALDARAQSLRSVLEAAPFPAVGVMIGPEGDFTPAEVEAAVSAGAQIVSLGARVLRTETAPLAALAAILYAAGEM